MVPYYCCCCKNGSDKFLGISIDTIFTALITIGIFILGLWLNKKNDQRKEFDLLIEIKTYFLQLVDILISATERQLTEFKRFSNELAERVDRSFIIGASSNFTTYNIDSVPNEKLFKIFVFYKSAKDKEQAIIRYKDLIINITSIRTIANEWRLSYQNFLDSTLETDEKFNENASKIAEFNMNTIFIRYYEHNENDDEFMKEFDLILSAWEKKDDPVDKYVMMDNLISPLRELCRRMPDNFRAMELLKLVMQCRYAFLKKENIRNIYKYLFATYVDQLTIAVNGIQKSITDIGNYKDFKPTIF